MEKTILVGYILNNSTYITFLRITVMKNRLVAGGEGGRRELGSALEGNRRDAHGDRKVR